MPTCTVMKSTCGWHGFICYRDMWTKNVQKCSITDFMSIIFTFWICSFIVVIFSSVLIFFFFLHPVEGCLVILVSGLEKRCVWVCRVFVFFPHRATFSGFVRKVICGLLVGVAFTPISFSSVPRLLATCFTTDTWIQPLLLPMPLTSLTCRQEANSPQTNAAILGPLPRCSSMQLPIRCSWEIMHTWASLMNTSPSPTRNSGKGKGMRCLKDSVGMFLTLRGKDEMKYHSLDHSIIGYTPDAQMMMRNMCKLLKFLVVQWLRIHLPTQGTWVGSLVRKDFTCRGATKPMSPQWEKACEQQQRPNRAKIEMKNNILKIFLRSKMCSYETDST